MKRFTVLGLCLSVALVFGIVLAAGAQAKKVETGPMVLRSFGGHSELGFEAGAVSSTSNKGHGRFETETIGTADSSFFGTTTTLTAGSCQSGGQEAGVVKTEPLTEELNWISKPGGEAGVIFKPAGTYLAQFECSGITFKVTGSVIGHVSPINVMAGNSKLNLEGLLNHNTPTHFEGEGGPNHVLESHVSTLPGESESIQKQPNVEVKVLKKGAPCKHEETSKEKCKEGSGEINGGGAVNPKPALGRCGAAKKSLGNYADAACTAKSEPGKGAFEWTPAS